MIPKLLPKPRSQIRSPQTLQKIRRNIYDELFKTLNLKTLDDWYKISQKTLNSAAPEALKRTDPKAFKSIAFKLMKSYPEKKWVPWLFREIPNRFWVRKEIQREFFDWLGEKLSFSSFEDWYRISMNQISKLGGTRLIYKNYRGSVSKAVYTLYPEYPWIFWKFGQVPSTFWSKSQNRRSFFDYVFSFLGYSHFNDWYKVTHELVLNLGGSGLLKNYYRGTTHLAIISLYPEFEWKYWMFSRVIKSYWTDPENRRFALDDLWNPIGFRFFEDWYGFTKKLLADRVRSAFLNKYYDDSMFTALKEIYPEYQWESWRFSKSPRLRQYFDKEFLREMEEKLEIKSMEDWYFISKAQIEEIGARKFIASSGGLFWFLSQYYPEYTWDKSKISTKSKQSVQRWLYRVMRTHLARLEILPHYENSFSNFHDSGLSMKLDIFIPRLGLAIEYHGAQHYRNHLLFGATSSYRNRDDLKRKICKRAGITLVEIPYWLRQDSLQVIKACRPDLLI